MLQYARIEAETSAEIICNAGYRFKGGDPISGYALLCSKIISLFSTHAFHASVFYAYVGEMTRTVSTLQKILWQETFLETFCNESGTISQLSHFALYASDCSP